MYISGGENSIHKPVNHRSASGDVWRAGELIMMMILQLVPSDRDMNHHPERIFRRVNKCRHLSTNINS